MIHTNRVVTVGDQESIIDRPIVLYRGDREVEVEFELIGNEFMFSTEGNVIKSVNASHGQLVLNTPSGDHMFSEVAECHDGKVVFVITKEMIDEFIEMGFYSFQIRLYDGVEMKSRVTIPPVFSGLDIRNPIAAEDETNVVDQAVVDYARIYRDQSNEEVPTFSWDGEYNKTEWIHHDVITENKMNKIEDAIWTVNNKISESDNVFLKKAEQMEVQRQNDVNKLNSKDTQLTNDIQNVNRTLTNEINKLKVDIEVADTAVRNELTNELTNNISVVNTALNDLSDNVNHIEQANAIYKLKHVYGAKGDGVTDDTQALKNALANEKIVFLDKGVYLVSDTLNINQYQAIIGYSPLISGSVSSSTIKYVGEQNNKKAVILLGKNAVGAEPSLDCSGNILMNVIINCNDLAGFGVYGTYLTNETLVKRIRVSNSLEYGCYFARSWYARFDDITVINSKNCGMAFGLPLTYLNDTTTHTVNWTTSNPLEMNNTRISNVRAHSNGRHFKTDNPGLYAVENHYNLGYGIGAGCGHSFHLCGFLSEHNGGAGLYVWSSGDLCKRIYDGYLEANGDGSTLDTRTAKPQIIINSDMNWGDSVWLESIHMTDGGGGIYSMGEPRPIMLRQIYRPSFLTTLNGKDHRTYISREFVHYDCGGYHNTMERYWTAKVLEKTINTRYYFNENFLTTGYTLVFVRKHEGKTPAGGFYFKRTDGTALSRAWNTSALKDNEWVFIASATNVSGIEQAGVGGSVDAEIDIRIVTTPISY